MTGTPSPDGSGATDSADVDGLRDRIARLERRVERERRARREAERIAEDGLRDLWHANQGLEQRVQERTAELAETLEATTVAAQAKERFLAELGHELKTPLHNVLGLLELVERSRLVDEDRRRLDEIRRHAGELSELLDGLVELAAAEGAPVPADARPADPTTWLDQLVATWIRPAARRAQLVVPTVSTPDQQSVQLDWRRLRRAADAVMSNATTHAGPGTVEVELVVESTSVRLDVRDFGPGVPVEIAHTALEPFVSAGPTAGLGVGLSLAHRLLDVAGGELDVQSDGHHTLVSLTLPRPKPAS
ncbi:MAG: HAMP domain-containing sensor histidine kinase [Actinomycetota bacterium]